MELLGRRVEEDATEEIWDAGPGAYRKTSLTPAGSDTAVTVWHVMCPGGCEGSCKNGMLLGPKPPASGHFVKENPDGSITVDLHPPEDPENSNSTLCPVCGWHGKCVNGIWISI